MSKLNNKLEEKVKTGEHSLNIVIWRFLDVNDRFELEI